MKKITELPAQGRGIHGAHFGSPLDQLRKGIAVQNHSDVSCPAFSQAQLDYIASRISTLTPVYHPSKPIPPDKLALDTAWIGGMRALYAELVQRTAQIEGG